MNTEHTHWVVVGILVVAIVGVGLLVKMQGVQLGQISNAVLMLARAVDSINTKIQAPGTTNNVPVVSPEASITGANRFRFGEHKVGDIIAGLKITSIDAVPGIAEKFGPDNFRVRFAGQPVTFDVAYSYENTAMSGDEAWITPYDPDKLPMIAGPIGDHSFYVTDLKKFRELISKDYGSGRAMVTMENFELQNAPAEVADSADLVRVLSKSKF